MVSPLQTGIKMKRLFMELPVFLLLFADLGAISKEDGARMTEPGMAFDCTEVEADAEQTPCIDGPAASPPNPLFPCQR